MQNACIIHLRKSSMCCKKYRHENRKNKLTFMYAFGKVIIKR